MSFFSRTLAFALVLVIIVGGLSGCAAPKAMGVLQTSPPIFDGKEGYHLIVVSGEPEGIAAALSAARLGLKTLLIEKGDALGGLMTLGGLNFLDMNNNSMQEIITRGIFFEFYNEVGNAYDIEHAKKWFLERTKAEPNLTVMLNTNCTGPIMDGNTVVGVNAELQDGTTQAYRALSVVDATVDADIAAAAGVPYTVGAEDYSLSNAMQGVTLIFELSGVNWKELRDALKDNSTAKSAWGLGKEAANYVSVDGNMRLRGPNIALLDNGNVLLNCLQIFGVDAIDEVSYQHGIDRGIAELPHIVAFMRENFPGFSNAEMYATSPRLYVRETRHIQGEYRLTITDVLENRDQWDRIGHGSYPVDIQSTNPQDSGNVIGAPEMYSIPFRSLVPLEVDGLLVAGRSASFDSLPHGSARVIPIGMVSGEACGVAAAYSAAHDISFRDISKDKTAIAAIQAQLVKQGAYLKEFTEKKTEAMKHWSYNGVAVMRELGMAFGGYENDYRLDEKIPNRWALQIKLNSMIKLANRENGGAISVSEITLSDDVVEVSELLIAAEWAVELSNKEPQKPWGQRTPEVAIEYLVENKVISAENKSRFTDYAATATYGQLYSVLGAVYGILLEAKPAA